MSSIFSKAILNGICFSRTPVNDFDLKLNTNYNNLSGKRFVRFVPTKVILVRNKDKPWFNDDCRLALDIKQAAHLRWTRDRSRDNWDQFVRQRTANE